MSATESELLEAAGTRRADEPPAVPISVRKSRLRVKDDNIVLDVPAPGLGMQGIVRTVCPDRCRRGGPPLRHVACLPAPSAGRGGC